jgi:hypothetical protein
MLSQKRYRDAAQRFFQQALKTVGHAPKQVTTQGHGSYPRAIRETLGSTVVHRCNPYLNNRLEQGHRGIKPLARLCCGDWRQKQRVGLPSSFLVGNRVHRAVVDSWISVLAGQWERQTARVLVALVLDRYVQLSLHCSEVSPADQPITAVPANPLRTARRMGVEGCHSLFCNRLWAAGVRFQMWWGEYQHHMTHEEYYPALSPFIC